jgi:hypothetical protein
MNARKKSVIFAVATITIGAAWLMNSMNILPGVEWIWTLGLAVTGALVIAVYGLDRVTVVAGPFLFVGALFSLLRQMDMMAVKYEAPALFIIFGLLVLVSALSRLKPPSWL